MLLKEIDTILFDLGGVLIDVDLDNGVQSIENSLSEKQKAGLLEWLHNSEASLRYELGQIDDIEFFKKIPEEYSEELTFQNFKHAWNNIFQPIECTIDILTRLTRNYELGALSNTNSLHIQYLENQYSFFDKFDKKYYSFELHLRKPDQAIYNTVLSEIGKNGSQVAFIDDKIENVKAAQQAGLHGLWYIGECRIRYGENLTKEDLLQQYLGLV